MEGFPNTAPSPLPDAAPRHSLPHCGYISWYHSLMTAPSSSALARYRGHRAVPWHIVQPVITAVRRGATYKEAADAGGVPPSHVMAWLKMGDEGHPIWSVVSQELRQARHHARSPAFHRRRRLIKDASLGQTTEYLQALETDSRLPPEADHPGGGGAAIQINIQKDFEPALEAQPPPKVLKVGTPTPEPSDKPDAHIALPRGEDD